MASRFSYLFAYLHLLSYDCFSSDLLSSNLFLLSTSALLSVSSVQIIGSLISKFPSITINLKNIKKTIYYKFKRIELKNKLSKIFSSHKYNIKKNRNFKEFLEEHVKKKYNAIFLYFSEDFKKTKFIIWRLIFFLKFSINY